MKKSIFYDQEADIEDRFNAIDEVYDNDFEKKLMRLSYKDFLASEYWHVIRLYKIFLECHCCQLCCSYENIIIHHRTYKNHGCEHDFLEDLMVVCRACHDKLHGRHCFEKGSVLIGGVDINYLWVDFIHAEKESHVRQKYIETKPEGYLKEQRFLDFITANRWKMHTYYDAR